MQDDEEHTPKNDDTDSESLIDSEGIPVFDSRGDTSSGSDVASGWDEGEFPGSDATTSGDNWFDPDDWSSLDEPDGRSVHANSPR